MKMNPMRLGAAIVIAGAVAASACFAQTAATTDPGGNAVPLAPLVAFVKPYIDVLLPTISTVAVGILGWSLKTFLHFQLNAVLTASLKSAAQSKAGEIIATAENNLAGQSIFVTDPRIRQAANEIIAAMPSTANLIGASPQKVAAFVTGEIGKLQAAQAPPPQILTINAKPA